MKSREIDQVGPRIVELLAVQQIEPAYLTLKPLLTQRLSFAILDRIGFVVGQALNQQFDRNPSRAFEYCHPYIHNTQNWYVTDSLGERLHGPALVSDFALTLKMLTSWRPG